MTIETDIAALSPLKDIIREHKLDARRKLGQNFLLDLNLTGRIAREAMINPDQTVIEIGPGPGGLTRAILMTGAKKTRALSPRSNHWWKQVKAGSGLLRATRLIYLFMNMARLNNLFRLLPICHIILQRHY